MGVKIASFDRVLSESEAPEYEIDDFMNMKLKYSEHLWSQNNDELM